jgi:hypothetical protein
MRGLEKHALSKERMRVYFGKQLDPNEELDTSVEVRVSLRHLSGWEDVTDEFVVAGDSVEVEGPWIYLWLKAAGAEEQLRRNYSVFVKATTSGGRILIETPPLAVDNTGRL